MFGKKGGIGENSKIVASMLKAFFILTNNPKPFGFTTLNLLFPIRVSERDFKCRGLHHTSEGNIILVERALG